MPIGLVCRLKAHVSAAPSLTRFEARSTMRAPATVPCAEKHSVHRPRPTPRSSQVRFGGFPVKNCLRAMTQAMVAGSGFAASAVPRFVAWSKAGCTESPWGVSMATPACRLRCIFLLARKHPGSYFPRALSLTLRNRQKRTARVPENAVLMPGKFAKRARHGNTKFS